MQVQWHMFSVGGKKGNRTEPNQRIIPDGAYEKFPIVAVPGFTSVTEPN